MPNPSFPLKITHDTYEDIKTYVNQVFLNQTGAYCDVFGRLRTSNNFHLFANKQISDNRPTLWDDISASGSGTASSYNSNRSSTTLSVSDSVAGHRIRQTYQRFNYQPGKSQMTLVTGRLAASGSGPGIISRLGLFDQNNGLYFQIKDGVNYVCIRSNTSGSVVENEISQSDWNLDKLDGKGPSGFKIDLTKVQIFVIDFAWLGAGRVRYGFYINGVLVYCHEVYHSNVSDAAYISTPNLPIRYEIINDGTGGAASLEQICSQVSAEGGQQYSGRTRYASTSGIHLDANTADQLYAILGIRLKPDYLSSNVKLLNVSVLSETNDNFEWVIAFNPTVTGTFTYTGEPSGSVEIARGSTGNTVANNSVFLNGGFVSVAGGGNTGGAIDIPLEDSFGLGATISGVPTEFVLCVRPLGQNSDIQASIVWREID